MTLVRWTLRIAAVFCLSGLLAVVLPLHSLTEILTPYGMPRDPAPLLVYLFRLSAAVIASCGAFFLYLSLDPARHGRLVPLGGGAVLFVGVVLLGSGSAAGVSSKVYLMDFLSCVLVGGAVVVSWLIRGRPRES